MALTDDDVKRIAQAVRDGLPEEVAKTMANNIYTIVGKGIVKKILWVAFIVILSSVFWGADMIKKFI